MIVRPALALPERDERSVTVAAAAERLGCDHTTVRELVRKGLLVGIRIGKTNEPKGIRVKIWSIEEWEEAHPASDSTAVRAEPPKPRRRRPVRNAADIEADALLKSLGA
jgi:excisionase family DNA binding protein